MDKLLLSSLSSIAAISDHLSQMQTSTRSASECAHSARALLPHSSALCARRMQRSEALLTHFRQSHADLQACLSAFHNALRAVAAHPSRIKARWDRLPDEWWRERAARSADLVDGVRAQASVVGGVGGYAEAVDGIMEGVRETMEKWGELLRYVEEWAPVARAVAEGLGEEGSLLPA